MDTNTGLQMISENPRQLRLPKLTLSSNAGLFGHVPSLSLVNAPIFKPPRLSLLSLTYIASPSNEPIQSSGVDVVDSSQAIVLSPRGRYGKAQATPIPNQKPIQITPVRKPLALKFSTITIPDSPVIPFSQSLSLTKPLQLSLTKPLELIYPPPRNVLPPRKLVINFPSIKPQNTLVTRRPGSPPVLSVALISPWGVEPGATHPIKPVASIRSLDVQRTSLEEVEECPICTYNINQTERKKTFTCCNKFVCTECVSKLGKQRCPFCMTPITDLSLSQKVAIKTRKKQREYQLQVDQLRVTAKANVDSLITLPENMFINAIVNNFPDLISQLSEINSNRKAYKDLLEQRYLNNLMTYSLK